MSAARKVLVVGGGPSGMAAAIALRARGTAVDLVEVDPLWRPLGAGISISGATLRALEALGLYGSVVAIGATHDGVDLCTPAGPVIGQLPTPPPVGSNVAGGAGVMRPALAHVMAEATRAAGVDVRLGCTFTTFAEVDEGVTVRFTDDTESTYDLVIGADGLHSKLRELLVPEAPAPRYVGQGVWRAVLPRPVWQERLRIWVGPQVKIGLNPVSKTHCYMFLTEDRAERTHTDPSTWPAHMAGLVARFPDPLLQALLPHFVSPDAALDYRPLFNLLLPKPWNRGRVLLIGDAVAATTPHLASGAGIGIESGIVIAEELAASTDLQAALDRFHARRWERCRLVVENSERLARIEIENGDKAEHAQIMRESIIALLQPI